MRWTPRSIAVPSTPSLPKRTMRAMAFTTACLAIPWFKANLACPCLWGRWPLQCALRPKPLPRAVVCKTATFGCSTIPMRAAPTPTISNWFVHFFAMANCFASWRQPRIGTMWAVRCLVTTTLPPLNAGKRLCKFRRCAFCVQVCWTKTYWLFCAPTPACPTASGVT